MYFKNFENEIPNTGHNSFGILKFSIPNIPDVNQINTKTIYPQKTNINDGKLFHKKGEVLFFSVNVL